MKQVMAGLFACSIALVSGCGGSAVEAADQYSCDLTSNGARVCTDTSFDANSAIIVPEARRQCTAGGGLAGSACDHAGATGGCRTRLPLGTNAATVTAWYYTISRELVMNVCANQKEATFVAP